MEMRVIKSDSEIQTIKKACEISAKAHNKADAECSTQDE